MSRQTTGSMWTLDIRKIQQAGGLLTTGEPFAWQWTSGGERAASINLKAEADRITLQYRHRDAGGGWEARSYAVRLSWSACNFGGRRAWWLCPVQGCGRRVAILYGGAIYACRQCQRLSYRTQQHRAHARTYIRADKIRARLGWPAGVAHGHGAKPKGMHWRTFCRLTAEHDAIAGKAFAGVDSILAAIRSRLNRTAI